MMKFRSSRSFTLVELLTVIVILIGLAGITVGVMGYIQNTAATNRVRAEIKAIELAVEEYKMDFGNYPGGMSNQLTNPLDTNFLIGVTNLYKSLTATNNPKIYLELKNSQIGTNGAFAYIKDPYGYAYGYISTNTANNPNVPGVAIWSTGGQAFINTNSSSTNKWITNWDPARD